MKKIFVVFGLVLSTMAIAQQQEQYSLYMMNNYLINPAVGGSEEFVDLKMGYRTQWVGLDSRGGAPNTMFVSGHAAVGKKTSRFEEVKQLPYHGLGAVLSSDNIGVWNVTNIKASYAYHLPVSKDLILSFGTFIGAQQYKYDASKAEFFYTNDKNEYVPDNAFSNNVTKWIPDMTLGIWAYSKNYYVGISSFQLFGNKVDFTSQNDNQSTDLKSDPQGRLARHYWITGGYRFPIGQNWHLIPSFVAKYVAPAAPQFDLNTKLRYQDLYWLGVSYRNLDAMVGLVGVTIKR